MKFWEMLKELQEKAGITQKQLAERSLVSLGSLRNHQQGIRQPSWDVVMRYAKVLGVSADVFATCDEVIKPKKAAAKKPTAKKPAPKKPKK